MATIFTESFETDGNGTRYTTSTPEFTDNVGDFFTRTDGSNVASFYQLSGQDGSFYFAGMDLNGEGGGSSETLTITGINITNFENLSLSLLVAEDDDGTNQDWDADSQLLIEVAIDGGAFQSLLDFQASGGTNTEPALDTDADGLGDGTPLSATFADFSSAIAGTGSSLDVRISFNNLESGDEDAAIDNIMITGDAAAVFDYDEAVDGDLSDDNLAPTTISLPSSGTFTIAAGQAGTPRDIDYVTINVPAGSQLDSFFLDAYTENQADGGAFFGIGTGTSLPGTPGNQGAGDLIGGLLFDETEIGTDILASSNGGSGTAGFTAPLGAGDYTLWFNQLGGTVNTFEATFNLSEVVIPPAFNLQITEIWPGNEVGSDLTEDWFEVTNTGDAAWVAATDGDLYFDDDSADATVADLLSGISQIDPGETVIFVDGSDTTTFSNVWSPAIDLTNVQIGSYEGSGLSGNGDGVTLFIEGDEALGDGTLTAAVQLDLETYPDAASNPGQSYDVVAQQFTGDLADQSGVATTAPNEVGESAVGTPGNSAPITGPVVDYTLELLHFTDQEANATSIDNIDNLSAVLNALRDEDLGGDGLADNTLTLSSGDAIIPGLFFDASEAVFGSAGIADIQIQNELGVQAIALGNHEFDQGTAFLAGLIDGSATGDFTALTGTALDGLDFTGTDMPYLSANLDVSTDDNLAPLAVAGGQDTATLSNVVSSSSVSDVNGELVGIVGATVPTLGSISSPGDVTVLPPWTGGTPTDAELDALAAEIQMEVDALLAANMTMDKVILLSHMQQISIEEALAERLVGVDIIVAGGSNTRLFDDNDRARDGDSDQGQYPTFITNAGGTTTAVVNTDGNYKYVGRLVIDFDANGDIIAENYDETVSGAYATDDQGVADLGAAALVDPEIDAITDAIQAEIVATESNVFGVSDVFLNGNRSGTFTATDPDGVRTQETNLGNLTADANLAYANDMVTDNSLAGGPVLISIKNGGGIRANIGEVVVPAGGTEAVRQPNSAVIDENGVEVKPEGGISQNDIGSTLAFNNGLVLVDMTRGELVNLLEGGVSALPSVDGGFLQIAGLKFSFDETQQAQVLDVDGNIVTPGERIQNAGIFDENDNLVAELVRDGELVGDASESFRVVTLNFLVDFGDPIIAQLNNLSNPNRVDLYDLDADGMDDATTSGAATFADDGTEQDALAEYLNDNFNPDNGGTAYNEADVGPEGDLRIQNLAFTTDSVLPPQNTFTLELLHFADQEANAATIDNIDNLSGVLNALRDEDLGGDGVADNTLTLSSGDAIIPGLFFDASEAVFGSPGIADIQIQNELGVEAIALGNHEFDLGTALLAGLIDGSASGDFSALTGTSLDGLDFTGADFPYLSTNLDFSTDTNLAPLAVAGGQDTSTLSNVVSSSSVSNVNGELVGIVGATVPTIRSISSPGDELGIDPAWASGTPTDAELDAMAAEIQMEVDALLAANPTLNKVVLLSHMQQISIEEALAERLVDVDIIVAGGSNTRLFDDNDRARDGDSVQGTYPTFITNAGGTTTAVVNTDGTYKYVGRLVIDFDENGNLLSDSYDSAVSGAYATDDQGVTDLGAAGLIDAEVDAITDAIQAQIVATESNVFGVSDVFLNGNRSGAGTADDTDGVRTQETNLGNLTADANLAYANQMITDNSLGDAVVISIKNGGGIRANIGEIVVPAGGTEAVRQPNSSVVDENGVEVKPEGGISQNDIGTTLAFNNGLTLLDITKSELKDFLEGAVAGIENVSGGFPQISGLKFSFDPTATAQTYDLDGNIAVAGERVVNAGIFDENDTLIAEIVRDGQVVGDASESFRIVTLNFLADAGDEILSTLSNPNRVDLIDLDADGMDDGATTGAATFSEDGTEQDALAEYLNDNFNPDNGGTAYNETDTGPALDDRIQNLAFREDTVLPSAAASLVISEIMYNPDSSEDDWEWVEITNTGDADIDLAGYVLDDENTAFHSAATIAAGTVAAGQSAVLYNADDLTAEQFSDAWGAGLNLVAVTDWGANGFNNSTDTVALWSSFADYSTDIATGSIVFDNAVDFVTYDDSAPWPVDNNDSSIYLTDLSADNNVGSNWALSEVGTATPTGVGRDSVADAASGNDGDVGSPGGDPEVVIEPIEIPAPTLNESVVGTIGLEGAEIVDWDEVNQQALVTSSGGLQVIDASDLSNLQVVATLSAEDLGFDSSDITSVSLRNGVIAVSRPDPTGFIDSPLGTPGTGGDAFTGAGQVLFYDSTTLAFQGVVQVGALPDMLTWNDAGTHLLVANEGQSSGDENQPDASSNPVGSVSIITFNATNPTASTVATLGFEDPSITFAALEAKGVRVNTNAPSAAADLEPEYITIEGNTAYVALQENNAVAVISDITAPTALTIDDILPLGTKDHSLVENRLDASNDDGVINLATYPIQGMFMPDGLASYTVDGTQYFLTANEGDGRDVDESRGADLVDGDLSNGEVDTTAFDAQTLADLADDAVLGRLKFSNVDGDTDGDGLIEELFSFGARSFSIYDENGTQVFDSGSDFAQIIEALEPAVFNGNDDGTSFDNRSDDKGVEPESVVLGEIDGRTYAFVGLERVGGVMVYDVTDPANASFTQYIRNEDENGVLQDLAPEGLRFISASDSPTGNPLLAVASEESNTLTFHELTSIDNTVKIHEIQGDTDFSALTGLATVGVNDLSPLDGQDVTIEAVVTADFQSGSGLQGFYVQEEDADADDNAFTSEGIFIFDGSAPSVDVNVGDVVRVTGTVSEFFGETQISASLIEVQSTGNALPTATVVEFPTVGNMIDQDGDFVADLEAVEGMLVTIPTEMTITEMFQLDRFGTFKVSADGRLEQFTQNNAPDAAGYEQHLQDIASRTLTIDDGQDVQNPDPILIPDGNDGTLTATDSFRMGDTLTNITGVVTYSEDFQSSSEEPEFRIHLPTAEYSADNPRPATPEDVTLGLTEPGVLKVASLNVLNYFTTIDDGSSTTDTGQDPRGADDLTRFGGTGLAGTDPNAEFDRQKEKLVNAIVEMDADILGLVELENSATDAAIADLVTAVNAALGSVVYDYIPTGVIGGDAIAQGLIYQIDSVTPTGDFQTLETFNGIDFQDPLNAGRPLNRPALAQTFTENTNGDTVTVAVNHLKSKGSLSGLAADDDQGDGQGNNNATRTAAADLLAQWLASDPTGQGSENILIVGDLNAYAQEDPITTLAAAGYTDVAADLIGEDAYSFVFDGQVGTLDYLLTNPGSLSRVTGITEWHINADEADAIDYNLDFGRPEAIYNGTNPARHSDHDPVIMGLDFRSVITGLGGTQRGTAAGEILEGSTGADFLIGNGGEDRFIGGGGDDRYIVDSFFDIVYEVAGEGYDRITTSVSLVTPDEVEAVNATGTDDVVIAGNASANWFIGNEGNNLLLGGEGNDRLDGRGGNDTITGDQGNDLLEGGADADIFVVTEYNGDDRILDFENGIDLIDISGLGLGFGDLLITGSGAAMINFAGGSLMLDGVAAGDLSAANFIEAVGAPSVPVVSGTEGDDNISLPTGPVEIRGLGGNDLLRAFTGEVTLVGGEGDDRMYVYDSNTVMIENAGEGHDTVYTRVDITLGDNIEVGATNGSGDIDITGNASDNRLTGNGDSNSLTGLDGIDIIDGRAGADVINGGAGVDFLTGGTEADSFVFGVGDGLDEILDFELGIDTIDLSNTAFAFGDLSITDGGSGALVDYSNGTGVDVIEVAGVTATDLTSDQFTFAMMS